jgi:hypothetical protein
MDNLVVVHTGHALNLLGHIRLLGLLRDELLQVLHLMLQVYGLSLTHLQLLVSLVQLGLKVVDIALSGGQLVLSVLQLGAGVVEVISLEVMAAISPHQLIIQLPDTRLMAGILLKKLSVALLSVLDGVVLCLHLTSALLQAEAQVSACRCDRLKLGAHMLGIACHEHPTRMACRKLRVANGGHVLTPHHVALVLDGEQGNGGVTEDRQVAITELHEGLVGSPLQSVVEVVTPSRGTPGRYGQVSGVSRNVHMDLVAPQPKLMVRAATVHGKSRVAEAVQQVLEQGGKPGAVQPIATEPSIGSKGDIGVVIHLSKIREKQINISSIKQRQ